MRRRDRLSRCARNILATSIAPFPSNCKDAAGVRLGWIGDERGQQNLLDLIDYDRIWIIGKADGNLMSINLKNFFRLFVVHRMTSCVHKVQPRRKKVYPHTLNGGFPARLSRLSIMYCPQRQIKYGLPERSQSPRHGA